MPDLLPTDRPYEELLLRGDFGLVEGIGLEIITHKLGGSFYRSILTGARAGERYWTLIYNALPDTQDTAVELPNGGREEKATYLWQFFCRHKTGYMEIDRPFVITDISTGLKFLARFADHQMERTLFMTKLFRSELKIVYARVRGFNVLADGSHDDDSNNAHI